MNAVHHVPRCKREMPGAPAGKQGRQCFLPAGHRGDCAIDPNANPTAFMREFPRGGVITSRDFISVPARRGCVK